MLNPEEYLNQADYGNTQYNGASDDEPPFPNGPEDYGYANGFANQSSHGQSGAAGLDIIDAGTDDWNVSPREWLLSTVFCREYVSSILADGGVGKTFSDAAC